MENEKKFSPGEQDRLTKMLEMEKQIWRDTSLTGAISRRVHPAGDEYEKALYRINGALSRAREALDRLLRHDLGAPERDAYRAVLRAALTESGAITRMLAKLAALPVAPEKPKENVALMAGKAVSEPEPERESESERHAPEGAPVDDPRFSGDAQEPAGESVGISASADDIF